VQAGSIGIYGSRRARTYAARFVNRTLSIARALGARSNPLPSGVLATLWPALEGIFVSPCSPTNISLCAGRLSGVVAAIFTHRVPESAPETARAAPRRARLARVGPRIAICVVTESHGTRGAAARASVYGP
jgi:hypothetical protein